METITPTILEENRLNKPFYTDFCTQIKESYEVSPPGRVFSTIVRRDLPNNWILLQFNLDHPRKTDEIGIRWSGTEVTVDFLPGLAMASPVRGATFASPICCLDNYGLRWVTLDYSKAAVKLSKQEKNDIERIITNVYGIAQYYKPYLRFILGHSAKVRHVLG